VLPLVLVAVGAALPLVLAATPEVGFTVAPAVVVAAAPDVGLVAGPEAGVAAATPEVELATVPFVGLTTGGVVVVAAIAVSAVVGVLAGASVAAGVAWTPDDQRYESDDRHQPPPLPTWGSPSPRANHLITTRLLWRVRAGQRQAFLLC
jgi:hypothetical protein